MDTMRIYVACLASYNAGRLHGSWFDLDDYSDADDLGEAVKEQVLLTSPYPNVMVECPACSGDGINPNESDNICKACHGEGEVPSAEEYAIHDHEGFPEGSVGEYTPFSRLYEIRERIEEAEDEFGDDAQEILEAFEYCFGDNNESISTIREAYQGESISTIREAYQGEYESCKEFSRLKAEDCGEIPENCDLAFYIDWEWVWNGRDQHDYSEHNGHFFYRNW